MNPQVGDGGMFGGDDGLGGYMPLAVATNDGTVTWVHANHMGVPIVYTDSNGAALEGPPGDYAIPGFPGQSHTLADLYYNRYRDYDPTTGRYIQADPIGLAGGANPYGYAMNNPLRYSDPTGEIVPVILACLANPVCRAAIGAFVGAGSELAIQMANNWWNGRDLFDCIEWGEVAVAGGLGAFGTNWLGGGVKLTPGLMNWANAGRRIRRAEDLVNSGKDLHHWLVPQRWYNDSRLGENIFNRPWNLNVLPERVHIDLHKLPYWRQVVQGAPGSVQGAGVLGLGGTGVEILDGEWE